MARSFERKPEVKMGCSQTDPDGSTPGTRRLQLEGHRCRQRARQSRPWDTASVGSRATAARKATSAATESPPVMSEAPRSRCCAAVTESAPAVRPRRESYDAHASGRPYITSPADRRRRSFANNPHDDSLQFTVRILRSSLFVQLRHTREELLCAGGIPHLLIGLPEQIQRRGVVRIERRRPLQLLDRLWASPRPSNAFPSSAWARERRIQLDRGLERGDGFAPPVPQHQCRCA